VFVDPGDPVVSAASWGWPCAAAVRNLRNEHCKYRRWWWETTHKDDAAPARVTSKKGDQGSRPTAGDELN